MCQYDQFLNAFYTSKSDWIWYLQRLTTVGVLLVAAVAMRLLKTINLPLVHVSLLFVMIV